MTRATLFVLGLALLSGLSAAPKDGNRLAYLADDGPFWPGTDAPRLTTPQWIGEEGVEAAVILAVDDMRETAKYEKFLRPILDELKKEGNRAPLSIMACQVEPSDPQLQAWLKEGLSIEAHTTQHPCPLLKDGLPAARATVESCIDLLWKIPGNRPVAFRTPCCDSLGTPSPRVFSEILTKTTPLGHTLAIDSSVMCLLTAADSSLPHNLLVDAQGKERFRKYFPQTDADFAPAAPGASVTPPGGKAHISPHKKFSNFGTYIENYPYPYLVGHGLWEFPCMVPSDWEAFNYHGPNHPGTVEDWKAALDAVVLKKGVFTAIFHPHGWIQPEQMVEFVRYVHGKYGKRVKFLNFREAEQRLRANLLDSVALRGPQGENVILADLDGGGHLEVIKDGHCRLWDAKATHWVESNLPVELMQNAGNTRLVLGVNQGDTILLQVWNGAGRRGAQNGDSPIRAGFRLKQGQWVEDLALRAGLAGGATVEVFQGVDGNGNTTWLGSEPPGSVWGWSPEHQQWEKLSYNLPGILSQKDGSPYNGKITGVRFIDLNQDGSDDVIVSRTGGYGVYIFNPVEKKNVDWKLGWSMTFREGKAGDANSLPLLVRADGTNNGVWFKHGAMWVQNEDTNALPDKVRRIPYSELLRQPGPAPKSPQDSLRALHVKPGFTAELVATEPLVQDPVWIDWDAQGRMWVVEIADYPFHEYQGHTYSGRIKILEDTKGTGVYDKATLFMDGLSYPNGLAPWRNGVFVSSVPEVFYVTEQGGKPGKRETTLSGFALGNPQHLVNGFCWGLDGWLYGGNGDSNGLVVEPKSGHQFDLSGRDFRFDPNTGTFNLQPGRTQYGRWRDDFGNWFGCNNSSMGWHYYLDESYLARNPKLAVPSLRRNLNEAPDKLRVVPVSVQKRFNWPDAVNTLTSGCNAIPYRDTLFGGDYGHSFFISEPANSLVHREVLEQDGVSFRSHRAEDEKDSEFLASEDSWSRFTMARPGPDGCLYVVDMYRLVIEHPQWIPQQMVEHLDLRAGSEQGRIYRIRPQGAKLRAVPRLASMKSAELVAQLNSPSGWVRDTAQRLLVERNEWNAEAEAASAAGRAPDGSESHAASRVQVLWTKHLLGKLKDDDLLAAMKDPDARVREHAVRLAEGRLPQDTAQGADKEAREKVLRRMMELAADDNVRVRYQVALSLGETHAPEAVDVLRGLAKRDGNNPDMLLALLTAAPSHEAALGADVAAWAAAYKQAAKAGGAKAPVQVITNHNPDREKVVRQYAVVAGLKGDPTHGHTVYRSICIACHRLKTEGMEVGPDLGTMAGKPTDQLVESIMDPSRAVEARYLTHVLTLKDGREVMGMISEETANSLTLKTATGTEVFLRGDIAKRVSSTKSLMPDGLENLLKPQDVADVIAWIREK